MMDTTYPEFTSPDGLKLEGESGEAMVNWKRKPDGNICITSIDGVPLGSEEAAPAETEDYGAGLNSMAEEEAA